MPTAAPPAEPKRFTDEELKQRYGIHLATRLQSDEPGKQANWADIEDDDDDWAPETIEWTDGTKITLPQADDPPAPAPEPQPIAAPKEVVVEKPKSPVPVPARVSPSPAVKPSVFGSGRAGLVLKGASEKPTLIAKPPGPPTPVKSPWASLPPVDKVAPVPVPVESQQRQPSQNRFSQRDAHGFNGMPPPPAKEIAADDFSRSWREGANTSRELYNSQSGRYEPVNDNRRGPMRNDARNDARAHQPAVLQRPSAHDSPAEPSAAFQTHRASGHEGYGRRRTSSNASGGSSNLVRRMSKGHEMPPPHEMLNIRRGSLAAVSDSPSSPRNFSPSGQHSNQRGHQSHSQGQTQGHQWQSQSRASPVVSHSSPQPNKPQTVPPVAAVSDPPVQAPAIPYEDPIEEQKKIMRATRELAIKRRQEEDAREEAARKERIRIKLEAMGPPPESKKKKDTLKEELPAPKQIQSRGATAVHPVKSQEPAPTVPGDGKATPSSDLGQDHAAVSLVEEKPVASQAPNEDVRPNGVHTGRPVVPQPSQDGRSSSWQNNPAPTSDRFKSWNAAPTSQPSSVNVWGPPTNDRTLGNGTFNPELGRLPEIHQSSHPGPIGPPNRGNAQFSQGRGREPYGSRPAPIGPPNRHQGPPTRQDLEKKAAVARSGWANLPQVLAHNEDVEARQYDIERTQKLQQIEQGVHPEPAGPMIKDTWRQVTIKEDGTRSKIQSNVSTVHNPSQTWKGQEESTSRGIYEDQEAGRRQHVDPGENQPRFHDGGQPPFNEAWRTHANANASPPVRGSRFFPSNRDVRLEEQYAQHDRPGSPSPPPPTMAGHPAYDGDIAHSHVSLPRPPPVVKLPPAPALAPIGPPPKPVSFAQAVQAPAVPVNSHNAGPSSRQNSAYQDIRRQEQPILGGWQDRISNLLGRKNSSPKSHTLAVDSSSKNALELPKQQLGATVSLPSLGPGDLAIDHGAVESKPAAEECFEEQEMGSLPIIKIPNFAPSSAWDLAPSPPKSFPRKFQVSHVLSAEPIHLGPHIVNNHATVVVKLPGQHESKTVTIAVASRQRSDPRRSGNSRGRGAQSSSSHPKVRGGRDASGGFPSPNHDNLPPVASSTNSGRGGRGARGYGTNWGRHSTPVHT